MALHWLVLVEHQQLQKREQQQALQSPWPPAKQERPGTFSYFYFFIFIRCLNGQNVHHLACIPAKQERFYFSHLFLIFYCTSWDVGALCHLSEQTNLGQGLSRSTVDNEHWEDWWIYKRCTSPSGMQHRVRWSVLNIGHKWSNSSKSDITII